SPTCAESTSRKLPCNHTAPSASKRSAEKTMDPSLVLFDMSAYRGRIEPTLKDFFAGGAEGAILHLLQETNRCVTENEPLRRRLAFPLGMQSEAMRSSDRERLLAELKSLPALDPRAGNEKRVADLKSKLPRFGTAGLIAKVLESQARRILPAGAGESVADRIA